MPHPVLLNRPHTSPRCSLKSISTPTTTQVCMMVGVKPVPDALGRVNKLEVIPLEELGRPRIDVVVNCSGVFRDLFVNQVCVYSCKDARGIRLVCANL